MKIDTLRVYADTSVFGGAFDEEFEDASKMFFDQVRLYNAVNTLQGHANIAIYSPREVIAYEDEDS